MFAEGKLHTFHARLKLKNIDREKKRVLRKLRGPEIEITHYTILYMKNRGHIFTTKKQSTSSHCTLLGMKIDTVKHLPQKTSPIFPKLKRTEIKITN